MVPPAPLKIINSVMSPPTLRRKALPARSYSVRYYRYALRVCDAPRGTPARDITRRPCDGSGPGALARSAVSVSRHATSPATDFSNILPFTVGDDLHNRPRQPHLPAISCEHSARDQNSPPRARGIARSATGLFSSASLLFPLLAPLCGRDQCGLTASPVRSCSRRSLGPELMAPCFHRRTDMRIAVAVD